MGERETRFVASPVDYDAWRRGYMPPSEHILIDQLMFRGARPIMSMDMEGGGAWWLVIRGPYPSAKVRKAIMRLLAEDDWGEPAPTPLAADEPPNGTTTDPSPMEPGERQ